MHTQCNPDANGPKLPSGIRFARVHEQGMAWNHRQRQQLANSTGAQVALDAACG